VYLTIPDHARVYIHEHFSHYLHLITEVKSAFNNVSRGYLFERMTQLNVEPDLIRWTEEFMSDRKVGLVLNGQNGTDHGVDMGIPQGSPVSPILFTTYLSGLFAHVEREVLGIKALSIVDDVAWLGEDLTVPRELLPSLGGMRSGHCPCRSRAVVEGGVGKGHPGQPGRHSETGKSASTGAFRTTNMGSPRRGIRPPATAQLNNRKRRFAVRHGPFYGG